MFINQGDGTFPNSSSYATGDNPHYLVAEDIDADVDLIVPNETNIGSISLFFNLGDGRVSDSRVDVPVSAGPRSVVVDDVDGDGALDIVAVGPGALSVLMQRGQEDSELSTLSVPVGSGQRNLVATDLDGDDDIDFVLEGEGLFVLRQEEDGIFSDPILIDSADASSVVAADFDSDGTLDLAIDTVTLYPGDGAGGYIFELTPFLEPQFIGLVAATDFDGDGVTDLLAYGDRFFSVLLNKGGQFEATELYESRMPGDACDVDGDGDIDIVVHDFVPDKIFFNRGDATFEESDVTVGTASETLVPDDVFGVSADLHGDSDIDFLGASFPNPDGTVELVVPGTTATHPTPC